MNSPHTRRSGAANHGASELNPQTAVAIDAYRRRRVYLLSLRAIGVGLLIFVSLTLLLATADYLFIMPDVLRWLLSVGVYAATALGVWLAGLREIQNGDTLAIAKHFESASPQLREELVSAVELAEPSSRNGAAYFRSLLQSRVSKRLKTLDLREALPFELVRRWIVSGALVTAILIGLLFIPSTQFGRRFARAALPGVSIERASRTKIEILRPSPQSGFVAERDAVGVVVRVLGASLSSTEDVTLHWHRADGVTGETVMTPRRAAFDESSDMPPNAIVPVTFAANLSVGSEAVEYQVTAGDGVTLWHKLIPLPRPRVIRYEKLYRMPEYAKLSDRTADEEHGDLKALQGTNVELIVTFDQPVEDAVLRFGVRGTSQAMKPADETGTRFLANLSMKTSGEYQVDATSLQSGLNNPFSPMHQIIPVLDTEPMVVWGDDTPTSLLVSPLSVLDLSVSAKDDLPMDQLIQEIRVNDETTQSVSLPFGDAAREIEFAWPWDLMHRLGNANKGDKLSTGDFVRTRVIARDRKGNRAETEWIELMIADESFDIDRHHYLEQFASRVDTIAGWAEECEAIARQLEAAAKESKWEDVASLQKRWPSLQKRAVGLLDVITQAISENRNPASATMTDLAGRVVLDIDAGLDSSLTRIGFLAENAPDFDSRMLKQLKQESAREAIRMAHQCERLRQWMRSRLGLAHAAAMYSDISALRRNVKRLISDPPRVRTARYANLLLGQFQEVDRLLARYEPKLPERTVRHLDGEHWSRWSQRWTLRLQVLAEENAAGDQFLGVLRTLDKELEDKSQHVIEGGGYDDATRYGRDLRKEIQYLADVTRGLAESGRKWNQTAEKNRQERNAAAAMKTNVLTQWYETEWQTQRRRLLVRVAGQERLQRAAMMVDLEYAADQSLFSRAVRNVTEEGYAPYKDESPEQVFDAVSRAIAVLQASHEFAGVKQDYRSIAEGERQPEGSPLRKVFHLLWFRSAQPRLELGIRYIGQGKPDFERQVRILDEARYNPDHRQVESRLDSRRWRKDPMVSAAKPLEALAADLDKGWKGLTDVRETARQALRRYVLSVSEQAEQAAQAARDAAEETDSREDESSETVDELKTEQQDAVDQAMETIRSLIDEANTADVLDEDQRERARDADAAAELIAEATREVTESVEEASEATNDDDREASSEQVEDSLDELAERLQKTAEHFRAMESGEDVSESRNALREAQQEMESSSSLDQRYDEAESMAETARQDPRELLKQLEEELKTNEPMQESLSDLSEEVVDDVTNTLRQAAEEEDQMQRRLENDDRAFAEQKRQKKALLDEMLQRTRTLSDRTLSSVMKAAERSGSEPQQQAVRRDVEELRTQLREAIDTAQRQANGDATMDEIEAASEELGKALRDAKKSAERLSDQFDKLSDAPIHKQDKQREQADRDMQREQNQLRNEELKSIDQQRRDWQKVERDAGNRIQSADRTKRSSEQALKRIEDRLEKDPDNGALKRDAVRQQERQQQSRRTSEAARETKQLASDRRQQANGRATEINRNRTQPFEKPNPAAEFGQKTTDRVAEQMESLSEELDQIANRNDGDPNDDLQPSKESSQNLQGQQQRVDEEVEQAAESLERASRHEQRLNRPDTARRLAQAAEETRENAGEKTKKAESALAEAAQNPTAGTEAGQSLQSASEALAEQADKLAKEFGRESSQTKSNEANAAQQSQAQSGDPNQGQASSNDRSSDEQSPSNEQESSTPPMSSDPTRSPNSDGENSQGANQPPSAQQDAEQKARTLDELDRQLSSSQGEPQRSSADQGSQMPGETQAGTQQPSSQTDSQQQSESPAPPNSFQGDSPGSPQSQGQSSQPSPQSSLEASPTLAQALEAMRQQAARERMRQLQRAQSGEPQDGPSQPNGPTESGQGEPPGGKDDLELLRGAITDAQWGDLRERSSEDDSQGRAVQLPRGYKNEIEAYFKAIARRAGEKNE